MAPRLGHDRIKVFISYKDQSPSKEEARYLASQLIADGFTVFYDVDSLKTGDKWEEKLYTNVTDSDVLVVLLDLNTAESDWVQREVDVARGANIKIVPLNITEDKSYIAEALKRLALEGVHYYSYCSKEELVQRNKRKKYPHDYSLIHDTELGPEIITEAESEFKSKHKKFVESILELAQETRDNQENWQGLLRSLRERKAIDPAEKSHRIYKIDDYDCELHIATGDIMDLTDIDVIVNSENDYMQMAQRIDNTLSSVLRYNGSEFMDDQNLLMGDTVQDELNTKIKGKRPITVGFVTETTGGHPKSHLVRNLGLRYIFHAVTVKVVIIDDRVVFQGISSNEIRDITKKCLKHLKKLNEENHPDNPLTNIFFPVFNAGKLKAPIGNVLPAMIKGIRLFLKDNPVTDLKSIHILAYNMSELFAIEDALETLKTKGITRLK